MQKSDYLQQKKLNPADELRAILASLEERQLKIRVMDAAQALQILQDLDQAQALFEQLAAAEVDLLPEEGRFQAVQARLKREAAPWLRALGGPTALSEQRPSPSPAPERWWWYIHEVVAAKQQRLLWQAVIAVVVLLLAIGGVALAFNTILAPSPEAVARVEAENDADRALDQGDFQTALAAIDLGLTKVPQDPGLLIYQGILYHLLGDQPQADLVFAQAQTLLSDEPLNFYVARSQLWLRASRPELAEQDVRLVVDQDENNARAWLLLGQALQTQGRTFEAIPAYERAGQVALDNGDNEIVVLSRIALGQIGAASP